MVVLVDGIFLVLILLYNIFRRLLSLIENWKRIFLYVNLCFL